jgi:ABC-2 type transport system ATP-binding protein
MKSLVTTSHLTKRYGSKVALADLSLELGPRQIVGLIGQNGSGKTTLLDLIAGLARPSSGNCETLGCDSGRLDEGTLSRLGVVFQDNRFLGWMRVEQHLAYFGSFYPTWDRERQAALLKELDLNPKAKIGHLSGGESQKLGIITAVCHHPQLLLLDEPLSALDPIARESLLKIILRLLEEDESTIVVSSHVLSDIERLVTWVVCLNDGQLRANCALAALQERFVEWRVTPVNGAPLPASFTERFVRTQTRQGRDARLVVEQGEADRAAFEAQHHAAVRVETLNLEQIYPLLVEGCK